VRDRGIALLMGLVLLAAISLLALMTVNGMLLQRRMSANFEASNRALGNAMRAATAARAWLNSRPDIERENGCLSGCLLPPAIRSPGELPLHPEFESAAWWRLNAVAAGSHPETGEPLDPEATETIVPRWVIEELHYATLPAAASGSSVAGVGYYRILARSSGEGPGSLAVTESIVARPWDGDYEPLPYPPHAPPSDFCRQFDIAVPCGMQAWRRRR
jgi:Tfp pilus assembly protein PilX